MTRQEAERQTRQSDALRALGFTSDEAEALRRISMTLQRWFERECGASNQYGSWAIVRGHKVGKTFTHDDDGVSYVEHHHYGHGRGPDSVSYTRIPDRETGARKRLEDIIRARNGRDRAIGGPDCTRQGEVSAYVQTDPRGAALYIIRPGDVPEGADVSSYYTRGVCVY